MTHRLQTFAAKLEKFAVFYKETRLKDEANQKRSTDQLTSEQVQRIETQLAQITAQIPKASITTPSRGIAPP